VGPDSKTLLDRWDLSFSRVGTARGILKSHSRRIPNWTIKTPYLAIRYETTKTRTHELHEHELDTEISSLNRLWFIGIRIFILFFYIILFNLYRFRYLINHRLKKWVCVQRVTLCDFQSAVIFNVRSLLSYQRSD